MGIKQWSGNIWRAQRNAAKIVELRSELKKYFHGVARMKELHAAETKRLLFESAKYSALTATLASEYYRSIGLPTSSDSIPDSIKEFHMLRGEATGWKYADDVRLGKPLWEKRQRQEVKRRDMEENRRDDEEQARLGKHWP